MAFLQYFSFLFFENYSSGCKTALADHSATIHSVFLSSLTDWGSTSTALGYWNGWPAEKKLCTKNISRLYILCVLCLSPFVAQCSYFHSYSPVTQLNAILPLCFPRCMNSPPPFSLSLSLSILGFTVSIPEGRSIDCNSLSMKSPLC